MNFLSHYFIDHIRERPYYNSALILPDISKRWLKKIDATMIPDSANPNQKDLLAGSLKHYSSDYRFHSSSFFTKYHTIINGLLKEVPFSNKIYRKWFIAHIMMELLIDRQIVKQYPEVVDSFYKSLNSVSDGELSIFLASCGLVDSTEFFNFLSRFRKSEYIYYYADNNKFLYSLGRIMMRVGINEPDETDGALLMDTFLTVEQQYMTPSENIIKELEAVFN